MSLAYISTRWHTQVNSYLLPLIAAVALHLLFFWLIGGGFDNIRFKKPAEPKVYKVVQASLVSLQPKKVIKKVVRAPSKTKPKAKPNKQVKKEKPAEKPKAETIPVKEETLSDESLLDDLFVDEDQALAEEDELTEVAAYSQLMKQTIEQNWSRPPSARNNMQVVLAIQLVPSGDVVSVTIRHGSGNPAFDRAAVLAVERVGRFDFLNKMPNALFEKHFRKIALTFKPEDLRL